MEDNKLHFNQVDGKECVDFVAVGVTFDNKQQILQQIFQTSMANSDIVVPVILQKEQNNKFDENAIKICLKDGRSIGYVSKQFNKDMLNIIPQIKRSYIKQVYMNNKRIFNAMIRLEF